MNKIIAVIGMCGSGKSEAVKFFVEKGYKRVYFGDVVFEEMKKEGLEVNEKNEKKAREKLRKEYGMAAMAILNIDKIKELLKESDVVIESLYSWEEYQVIKEVFKESFKLLCIYTTKELRYGRLTNRKERPLTVEEANMRDLNEINNLSKGGPIAYADFLIKNDSTLEELKKQMEALI